MSKSKFDASKISLQSHGVLIEVHISSYSGSSLDREASTETAQAKNSKASYANDAYRVNKVVYNRDYLRPVSRISLGFYKWLRARSHEWARGVYLIKAESLHEVLTEYQKTKVKFNKALAHLNSDEQREVALQDYRDRAGTGFDESLWPSIDQINEKFQFSIDVEQLPDPQTSNALIFKIGEQAADKIKQDTEKRLKKKAKQIAEETAQRIAEIVEKIQSTLSDQDAKFKDSLIGNLRGLVEIIDTLNITGDPEISAIKRDLQKGICTTDPQSLRDDPVKRKDTAKEAKRLLGKLKKLS